MKIIALSLWIILFVGVGFAQTSSFTYQGKLTEGGTPATGPYDFVFRLYDAPSGGTQIGGDNSIGDVQVAAGIFTVNLNFGTSPFVSGADRYLQISVRAGASTGAYTALTPLHPLTSSPYAVQTINAAYLGGVAASQYVQTTDPRMSDARTPLAGSPDYIQSNPSTPQAATNLSIGGGATVGGTITGNTVNSATQYNIGNQRVLSSNETSGNLFVGHQTGPVTTTGNYNSFVGVSAGLSNTAGYLNSFFGAFAGASNVGGSGNVFVGNSAGGSNTEGYNNSFVGSAAGQNNSTGVNNAFFGATAGFSNTTGSQNAFFGMGAGVVNSTGVNNSFVGYASGARNTTGIYNSFFGVESGFETTTGDRNTFVGSVAGRSNTTGSRNSFFGTDAGFSSTTANDNAYFGFESGKNNATGNSNAFFGTYAGNTNSTGSNNTLIGFDADVSNGTLNFATALGAGSVVSTSNTVMLGRPADIVQVPGAFNVSGTLTTPSIGSPGATLTIAGSATDILLINRKVTAMNELRANAGILTHAIDMASAGAFTLGSNTATSVQIGGTGTLANVAADAIRLNGKTFVSGALSAFGGLLTHNIDTASTGALSIGSSNATAINLNKPTTVTGLLTANGGITTSGTLNATTFDAGTQFNMGGSRIVGNAGTNNLFVGINAGAANAIGSANSFFGKDAGLSNTDGASNSFFGSSAGSSNTLGASNSFFGTLAGQANTEGASNSFFGVFAGQANTTGGTNSFFGRNAGLGNTTGAGNTVIGALANVSSSNLTNASAIGYQAAVSQSNSLVLGSITGINGAVANTNVGIGIATPAASLHVTGTQPAFSSLTANSAAPVLQVVGPPGGNSDNDGGTGSNVLVQAGNGGNSTLFFGGNGGSITLQPGVGGFGGQASGNGGNLILSPAFETSVLIGTSTPGAKLFVNNNLFNNGYPTATFAANIGTHRSHIQLGSTGDWYIRSSVATGKVVLQDTGGSVGIGTTAPQQKLHVDGDSEILSSGTGGGFKFRNRGSSSFADDWVWYSQGNIARFFRPGTGDMLKIDTTGNIAVTKPSGLIIRSPDNACWSLNVSNGGGLSTTSVTCP